MFSVVKAHVQERFGAVGFFLVGELCVVRAVCGGEKGSWVCPDLAISSDPRPDVLKSVGQYCAGET